MRFQLRNETLSHYKLQDINLEEIEPVRRYPFVTIAFLFKKKKNANSSTYPKFLVPVGYFQLRYFYVEQTLSECDDELIALTEGAVNLAKSISPPNSSSSEEESGSDVESLHSFHYSPKGVDYPSAHRLAKRLYHLDGFKKSDVSRHLSKK